MVLDKNICYIPIIKYINNFNYINNVFKVQITLENELYKYMTIFQEKNKYNFKLNIDDTIKQSLCIDEYKALVEDNILLKNEDKTNFISLSELKLKIKEKMELLLKEIKKNKERNDILEKYINENIENYIDKKDVTNTIFKQILKGLYIAYIGICGTFLSHIILVNIGMIPSRIQYVKY